MWLHDQYRIQGYHYSSLRSMHSKDRFLIIFASLAPESTRLDLSFFILFLSSFLLFLFEFSAMCISIKHLSNCSSGLDSHTYQCTTDTDGDVSVRSSWYPQSFVLSIYKDGCPSTLTLNNLTLSSLSSANIILSYIVYSSSIFVHLQKWQTNAPVTPSPSSKPPTATSSPGDAQTAIPAPSWLSGVVKSVATVVATHATTQRHNNHLSFLCYASCISYLYRVSWCCMMSISGPELTLIHRCVLNTLHNLHLHQSRNCFYSIAFRVRRISFTILF